MKILIVEDDAFHRTCLKEAIVEGVPECQQVIEASNGNAGEQLAREHLCLRVVMDLQMGPGSGIEAARTIWAERPETCILFWSNYADEAYVRGVSRVVPPGAAYGYVLKSASGERLKLALRSVFIASQCVIDREVRGVTQQHSGRARSFTDLEFEVLTDISLGLTDRTIAQRRGYRFEVCRTGCNSFTRSWMFILSVSGRTTRDRST